MAAPDRPASACRTWKMTVAYDGTDYRGWQVQPGERTIQGELQQALGRVTGETPLLQGSGRTDAGVHALRQVASFLLSAPIPADNLLRALNRTLPASIRILETATMPDGFHARYCAIAKTYEYRVWVERRESVDICPPFIARYVHACPWNLKLDAMEAAAGSLVGEHDFASFAATDPDLSKREQAEDDEENPRSTVRRVFASGWHERMTEMGPMLIYHVRGSGFLHHMVRNFVGTLIDVGRGALHASEIHAILEARSRSAAGPTAPACGLFLHSVEYDEPPSTARA